MSSKIFTTTIVREGSAGFIPVPFDPKSVFGKVRAPVRVTLNGYTYRSTIADGGVPKQPRHSVAIPATGLDGDRQRHTRRSAIR